MGIKYTVVQINQYLQKLQSEFEDYYLILDLNGNDKDDYQVRQTKESYEYYLERTYQAIQVFLEYQQQPAYLQEFKRVLEPWMDPKKYFEVDFDHENGIPFSKIGQLFLKFLHPFLEFADRPYRDRDIKAGRIYLENVLKSTPVIIKEKQIKIDREAQVYKAVESVLHMVFPSHAQPQFSFLKQAQEYKPDIVLVDLRCAVEYKYVRTAKNFAKMIGQIHDDVKGYGQHPTINTFYAVFYIQGGLLSEPRCRSIWKNSRFPPNWIPIYCMA